MASTALKTVSGLAVTGAGAFTALTKSALDGVGAFEQNIGGVEKLFGDAAQKVIYNSKIAFNTAGMSANEYMENVTGFAASLVSGLGGDTKKAAEIADVAIRDMSDNANTFGTDIQNVTTVYQNLAKGQFQLLDNLKLGFGGTQEGMAQLINKYGEFDGALEVTSKNVKDVPFDQMILAIHNAQEAMNITGTTSKEAADTIQGSMASAKAAWDNFLSGASDVEGFSDALYGAIGNISKNLMDIVPSLSEGLITLIEELGPYIPTLVEQLLPSFVDGTIALINGLIGAMPTLLPMLITLGLEVAKGIGQAIIENKEEIVNGVREALDTILSLIGEFSPTLATLLGGAVDIAGGILSKIGEAIAWISENFETFKPLIDAVVAGFLAFQTVQFIVGFISGLAGVISTAKALMDGMTIAQYALNLAMSLNPIGIIIALVAALVVGLIALWNNCDEFREFVLKMWDTIKTSVSNAVTAIKTKVGEMVTAVKEKFTQIWDALKEFPSKFKSAAHDAVQGFINGIKEKISSAVDAVKGFASNVWESFKGVLDIHSPSKKFAYAAEMCIAGYEDTFDGYNPYDALANNMTADAGSLKASFAGAVGNSMGLDYSSIGSAVRGALADMGVYIDGRTAGRLLAESVDSAMGTLSTRRV